MRLRTECDGGHVSGFSHDHEHDAAAAHALLKAMRKVFIEAEVHEVEGIAAELMREWGYKEQEVE